MQSLANDQKMFHPRICFFIHGTNDIGYNDVDSIKSKPVGTTDSKWQTAEIRIGSNWERSRCLRQ